MKTGRQHRQHSTWGTFAVSVALVALSIVSGACRKAERNPPPVQETRSLHKNIFRPYDSLRSIVDSIRIDLNKDGVTEFVVTSRDIGQPVNPAYPKEFDRLEIFALDTGTDQYTSLFIDPVESGYDITCRDIVGDKRMEIIVSTNSGGNDPISSQGMSVYGYRKNNSFSILFYSQGGVPEIKDIDGDAIPEIVVTGEYWGIMSHADVIAYTSVVYRFDSTAFVESNEAFAKYFDKFVTQKKNDYLRLRNGRIKDPADHALALYRAFADWVLWISSKGDMPQLKRLWESEKNLLETRLSPDQFDDLETLVLDTLEQDSVARHSGGERQL